MSNIFFYVRYLINYAFKTTFRLLLGRNGNIFIEKKLFMTAVSKEKKQLLISLPLFDHSQEKLSERMMILKEGKGMVGR